MLSPRVSDTIHFYQQPGGPFAGQPLAAIITHVHSDRLVNLVVFDPNGNSRPQVSVPFIHPGYEIPAEGYYCQWPLQIEGEPEQAEVNSASRPLPEYLMGSALNIPVTDETPASSPPVSEPSPEQQPAPTGEQTDI